MSKKPAKSRAGAPGTIFVPSITSPIVPRPPIRSEADRQEEHDLAQIMFASARRSVDELAAKARR